MEKYEFVATDNAGDACQVSTWASSEAKAITRLQGMGYTDIHVPATDTPVMPFTWLVRFDVAPEWVADGFAMTDETAMQMLARELGHACRSTELSVRVIASPSALRIAREQGYGPKTAGAGVAVQQLLAGAPHAFQAKKGPATIDTTLVNAINLLDSVAFVRDEKDGTAQVLADLRAALDMVRGNSPISAIEWQRTPE